MEITLTYIFRKLALEKDKWERAVRFYAMLYLINIIHN